MTQPFLHILFSLLLFAVSASASAQTSAVGQPVLPLIPMPSQVHLETGTFATSPKTPVIYQDQAARWAADYFTALLQRSSGISLHTTALPSAAPAIQFNLLSADSTLPAEGYRIHISSDRVEVSASHVQGLFYGAVSLWQLAAAGPRQGSVMHLPQLQIEDAPRFRWRGYMLDSARNFQSVSDIKRLLDAMAIHKLNVFHWHLTDDQGWRVQIRKYPKLTAVGGLGMFYSQAQIREIVHYAAQRNIMVVPEIDLPGHATAAIAAYPQLGIEGRAIPVSNQRGIHNNLFNIEDSTFAFLADVLTEVAELFPAPYIHIGGDEAVKTQWKASPRIQAQMRTLGIQNEAQLQSWFIKRLETMLEQHGKRLIGWDEILEGGLPASATVMSWRGTEGGFEAARQGHDVIMSPTSAMYLDYLQTASPNEPAGRPKLVPLASVYAFEPVPEALDTSLRGHILGLQANMWTGDTRTFAGVEHNSFPRLAAVAEVGWTPASNKNYDGFLQRLPTLLQRYRELGIGYAKTPFEVLTETTLLPQQRVLVTLQNPTGYPVYYREGRSNAWTAYQSPLDLHYPAALELATFANGTPLTSPQVLELTQASLLTRSNAQLSVCNAEGPVLRMEDDGPPQGARALFNVAIFEPCWLWKLAPLQGITSIQVRAGRLPYLFQLGDEESKRVFLPAKTAYGELDIRLDSCSGPILATAPLPAAADADGFITVSAPLTQTPSQTSDLCIRFSGDTRPAMWVLDRISLHPHTPPAPEN
ncbi:MAG: beta-N-acetylhexosaminidase [Thermomonas sp.]|nr:beta-N-acetylhexosaminidase [Thermomonas sp.]